MRSNWKQLGFALPALLLAAAGVIEVTTEAFDTPTDAQRPAMYNYLRGVMRLLVNLVFYILPDTVVVTDQQ